MGILLSMRGLTTEPEPYPQLPPSRQQVNDVRNGGVRPCSGPYARLPTLTAFPNELTQIRLRDLGEMPNCLREPLAFELSIFPWSGRGISLEQEKPGLFLLAAPEGEYRYRLVSPELRTAASGTLIVTSSKRQIRIQRWLQSIASQVKTQWIATDDDALRPGDVHVGTLVVTGQLETPPKGTDPVGRVNICITESGAEEPVCKSIALLWENNEVRFERQLEFQLPKGEVFLVADTEFVASFGEESLDAYSGQIIPVGTSEYSLWQMFIRAATSLGGVAGWTVGIAAAVAAFLPLRRWLVRRKSGSSDAITLFHSDDRDIVTFPSPIRAPRVVETRQRQVGEDSDSGD